MAKDVKSENAILMQIHAEAIYNMCKSRNGNCADCPFCKSYVDTDDPYWCKIGFPSKWEV